MCKNFKSNSERRSLSRIRLKKIKNVIIQITVRSMNVKFKRSRFLENTCGFMNDYLKKLQLIVNIIF